MKAIKTIVFVCLMGFISCQSQSDNKPTGSKKENKQLVEKEINLLDEQTKMFGQIFDLAGAGDENPFGGTKNYPQLIEKMDAPEELKQQLMEMYKVYDLSLDPTKKDSLKLMVDKMLRNALDKTQNHSQLKN